MDGSKSGGGNLMPMPAADFSSDDYLFSRAMPVPESGCYVWMRGTVKGGYGKTGVNHRTVMAHRAVYEARVGPIPEGAILCHTCDNPACVNPAHMFIGTHKTNSEDMVSKGRQAKGERVPLAKIDEQTVRELRAATGSHGSVARRFGLKPGLVRQVRIGETWRHVA